MSTDPRALVTELCRHFYFQGWCTGTGGGMSVRDGERIYLAPSGVQKERIKPEDVYVLDADGRVIEQPADPALKQSECKPLFYNAYRDRDAGAVLHSHSRHAMLASLLFEDCFEIAEQPVPEPGPGEALAQVCYLGIDPTIRGWLDERGSYMDAVGIGDLIRASGVGVIVETNDPEKWLTGMRKLQARIEAAG